MKIRCLIDMVFLYCALGLTAIMVVLLFVVYRLIFERGRVNDITKRDFSSRPQMIGYVEKIKQGVKWLEGQKTERVFADSRDSLKLSALYIPCKESKHTIILFHGYRSMAKNDFSGVLEYYNSLGLNILLVDQRAHGQSEGKYIGFGILERFDCLSWTDYIIKRNGEDCIVFLGGISMGASTVMMAAGEGLPKNVKGIIADCGYTSPWEIVSKVARQTLHIPAFITLNILNVYSKLCAGYSLKEYSTLEALKRTDVPVFFLHGLADDFVPYHMTKENFEACSSPKRLLLVENAGHGFSYFTELEKCQNEIKKFFEFCELN